MTISDDPTRAGTTASFGYGPSEPEMTARAQVAYDRLGNLTPKQRRRLEVAHVRCGQTGCTESLMPIFRVGGDVLAVPRSRVFPLERYDRTEGAAERKPRLPFILGEDWSEPPVPLWCKCGWPADGRGHVLVDPRNLTVILNTTAERNLVVGVCYAGIELQGRLVLHQQRRGR